MNPTLDRLKSSATERQQLLAAQWRQLVADIATGEASRTDAEIIAELDQLGRTLEQLDAAVARHLNRKKLAATVAELPSLEAEHRKLGEQRGEVVRRGDEDALRLRIEQREAIAKIDEQMAIVVAAQSRCRDASVAWNESVDADCRDALSPLQSRLAGLLRERDSIVTQAATDRAFGLHSAARQRAADERIGELETAMRSCNDEIDAVTAVHGSV